MRTAERSKAIGGAGRVDSADPAEAMAGFAAVQRQFVTNGEFTAGLATHYPPGLLTGDDTPGLATSDREPSTTSRAGPALNRGLVHRRLRPVHRRVRPPPACRNPELGEPALDPAPQDVSGCC